MPASVPHMRASDLFMWQKKTICKSVLIRPTVGQSAAICKIRLELPSNLCNGMSLACGPQVRLGFGRRSSGTSHSEALRQLRCVSSGEAPVAGSAADLQVLELPCLPFVATEVLVPGSTKQLHLYEARYLALLEEALTNAHGMFAHMVLQPVAPENRNPKPSSTSAASETTFVASHCCLTHIENVRRLDVGALVTVRGIARLRLLGLTQTEPFLKGSLTLLTDRAPGSDEEAARAQERLAHLKSVLSDVQHLQIRLKTAGDVPLQTPLEAALQWAERTAAAAAAGADAPPPRPSVAATPPSAAAVEGPSLEAAAPGVSLAFVPRREELVPFAALQPVAGATTAELHRLLQKKLMAMETADSLERIELVLAYAEEARAALAAKLAIQSLSG